MSRYHGPAEAFAGLEDQLDIMFKTPAENIDVGVFRNRIPNVLDARERGIQLLQEAVAKVAVKCNKIKAVGIEIAGGFRQILWHGSALESVPDMGYQDIKEGLIPRLYDQGQHIAKYVVAGESFARVRCAGTYLAANMWALQRFLSDGCLPKGYAKVDGACVHESAEVDRSVRFVGPVLVESGTIIEADAIVVGPTTIGERCTIGRDTVISCSVIWDDCGVGTAAVLEHCILADHSGVDPGAVLRDSICMLPQSLERSISANEARDNAAPEPGCRCVNIEAVERNGEAWKLEPVKDDGLPSQETYVETDEQC